MAEKPKFFKYFNLISYLGMGLAILVFLVECALISIDFIFDYSNSYLSLLTYLLLPPFLIAGLLMIPLGAFLKMRSIRRGKASDAKSPMVIDLFNPSHRKMIFIVAVIACVFLVMTAVGSYKAFHYTESVRFCGKLCHGVMKPEYTSYLESPHGRVKCVECHIGAGAGWYAHSKLSGVRQVFKTILNAYDRPIAVPVHDLRPAKEICEVCHWPGKAFEAIGFDRTYFSGETGVASRWNTRMLMRVSGNKESSYGIHAHMSSNNAVYYAADDEKRQKISWVKTVSTSGEETVYTTKGSAFNQVPPSEDKIRKMDCIDCHSRPSHQYKAPMPLVNRAMVEGKIDPGIPGIKAKAVEVMAKRYSTEEQAVSEIRAALLSYYKEKQSAYYMAHEKEIGDSIEQVVQLFKNNIFPEMKVRWDEYPDNIGHMISPGCFRCHDGEHSSPSGKSITRDCSVCHVIIAQGPVDAMEKNVDGVPFKHPFNEDESWKEMNCTDCHSGAY